MDKIKHTCQCNNNANDENLKKLEIMAKGSFSERTMKSMFIALIIFNCILIISISIIAIYGINRYYTYLMNTETVESVEVVEEIIENTDGNSENYKAGGNIIQGSNFDNSSIGGNYGSTDK